MVAMVAMVAMVLSAGKIQELGKNHNETTEAGRLIHRTQ